ncbi:MAG: hypothetical protein IPP32_12880, partial [Bacteroidetes bacterium]|nr:hypothetical protein [Bacteroidota bacterium]
MFLSPIKFIPYFLLFLLSTSLAVAENKEELSDLIKSSIRNREQGNFESSISDAKRAVKLANTLKLP